MISSKKIFPVLSIVFSLLIFLSFNSCQIEGDEENNSDSLVTLIFAKESDETPADCILCGEHGKNYFSVTGYKRKSSGFGLDKIDLIDKSKIKIISQSKIPCNIEITDTKKFNFIHGIEYELECTLEDYNNSAKLKLTPVKQYDMYGQSNVEQTLIKGLVYPYHQIFTSFTNEACTIGQNQTAYLDEKLGEQFSMFAGSNFLNLSKISDVKNLVIDDNLKIIYIYGKGDLEKATTDYSSIKIEGNIKEMSDDYPLTMVNYYDGDNKEHKFENQKKDSVATNYGANLYMQAGLGYGYVMVTDADGKLKDGIKINIHESNYSDGKWKSNDIVAKDITNTNDWTPNKTGTYYIEVICSINGVEYSNGFSNANTIKVTNE